MHDCALLTTSEMAKADALAIASGVTGAALMEAAGRAVATEAAGTVSANARIYVMCGPGNNGGDGFVAARFLAEAGYRVEIALLRQRQYLRGDAALVAAKWNGAITKLDETAVCHFDLQKSDLVIDAVFGAGLDRHLSAELEGVFDIVRRSGVRVLAVDVPSGINGNTGAPLGKPLQAASTVTFFRAKPGHLLLPGRSYCGRLVVADIGIPCRVLDDICPPAFANRPELWMGELPPASQAGHKYERGHAVVVSGPLHATGAARLGARGALRIGAGLVSVAASPASVLANAAHLTAIMVRPFDDAGGLAPLLSDTRLNAYLIGPGAGVGDATRRHVDQLMASPAAIVMDADALTSFAEPSQRDQLFTAIKGRCAAVVLTPHEGEFERLFGRLPEHTSKLQKARYAASLSGAMIILKGADTVITSPDGRAAINDNAPPALATAGSGDVLAGFVTGLLAQGMKPFEAACASVWMHGACAVEFGPGLIAEDLPELLPRVLAKLKLVQ